ncbi:MAG: LysM peptidoglycan-binding domain-containing protein [Anaeromicrobium sp.]|uniref:cell division suppressor protein YneA n=1 Tax=Anaeromicrobium sp. TaxID=1929132 RepID=UPI0025E15039|nr:LysM peptidoglycan-binding domain-containing protein [Anaeromicrobium sp.]MCT4596201.1 LysM peptidoglycan-binding domain-containing protein [Anaeromicrobium sp.]
MLGFILKYKRENIIILIMLIIGVFLCTTVSGVNNFPIKEEKKYIEIYIEKGDTIWTIARKFTSKEEDIRKTVHMIGEINNLNSWDIYPGQSIKVPTN